MNKKLILARAMTGKGPLQFFFFLILAFIVLFCLYLIGCLIGKVMGPTFEPFEILMAYIDPGNGWKIKELNSIQALTGNPITDWYLPVVGIFGAIIFTGLLVSVFTNIVQYWVGRIRDGHLKYNLQEHFVIIGYDAVVPSLVKQILTCADSKNKLIVIASKKPVADISNLIRSKVGKQDEKHIVYMHSEHFSLQELSRLDTHKAHQIFVVGDPTLGNRDAENMRILMILHQIHSKENAEIIPLTMWFDNETTYAAMQLNDIKSDWSDRFDYRPYNFYNDWADRLLVSGHYHKGADCIEYPPMDREGISKDSDKHVHLIVVGMNRMGVAVAKEAAHMMHFPNFDENAVEKHKTIITFIDDHADREMAFFKGRHPGYFEIAPTYYWDAVKTEEDEFMDSPEKEQKNYLDVQFQFIKGRIESDRVREWLIKQAKDSKQYLTIAVCLSDSTNALGVALYLPEDIYYCGSGCNQVNLFVRQESTGALIEILRRAAEVGKNKRFANLYPFGMIDNSFDFNEQDYTVAQVMNYVYDYYYANNRHEIPTTIPEKSELERQWGELSISLQWSNIYLADSLIFKLRAIGYNINCRMPLEGMSYEDKQRMARVEHNRWNMEKLLIGYRALNEQERKEWTNEIIKEVRKTRFIHHDIRPYDDLPNAEQQNDKNIIDALPMVISYMIDHDLIHCHT